MEPDRYIAVIEKIHRESGLFLEANINILGMPKTTNLFFWGRGFESIIPKVNKYIVCYWVDPAGDWIKKDWSPSAYNYNRGVGVGVCFIPPGRYRREVVAYLP